MNYQYLLTDINDNIITIRLNRPDAGNALCMQLRDEIEDVFKQTENNSKIQAAVLTGSEKFFSFGFDIQEVIKSELQGFYHRFFEYHYTIYSFSKPLVCAVNGFATGGGFDLALAGDIIIAAEKSLFGRPEIKFGAPPLMFGLLRRVTMASAKNITFSGDFLNSEKALKLGIIDERVKSEKLLDRANQLAKKLAKHNSGTIAALKNICYNINSTPTLKEVLQKETDITMEFLKNPDALPTIEKYFEKLQKKGAV